MYMLKWFEHPAVEWFHRASIKGSLGVIYSQKSSSYFQMLKIGSEVEAYTT